MLKKITSVLIILIFIPIIIIAHQLSYDNQINFLNFHLTWNYKNYYKKFFYLKDENPILVWRNETIKKYIKKCHQNKKNCLIIPNQQFYADLIWISSIQYVWSVMRSTDMPYLYGMLDNLTNLSPYWSYPYFFWELIIPISKVMYQDFPLEKKKQSRINAVKLGEKWIFFTCDKYKVEKIINLPLDQFYKAVFTHTWKLWNDLIKPCIDYQVPSQWAFDRWFFLQDSEKAAQWYKIASFDPEVPKATPTLVAIVLWRTWKHEKSMLVWFNQYLTVLNSIKNKNFNEKTIKFYQQKLEEFFQKALLEYQFYILQQADNIAKEKNELQCFHNYECLVNKWLVKEAIFREIENCKKISKSKIDLTNIKNPKNLKKDITKNINLLKCSLLYYWLQSGLINPNNNKTPLIPATNNKFQFWYDYDLNDWWLK